MLLPLIWDLQMSHLLLIMSWFLVLTWLLKRLKEKWKRSNNIRGNIITFPTPPPPKKKFYLFIMINKNLYLILLYLNYLFSNKSCNYLMGFLCSNFNIVIYLVFISHRWLFVTMTSIFTPLLSNNPQGKRWFHIFIYIHIYIYMYMCVCVCVNISFLI